MSRTLIRLPIAIALLLTTASAKADDPYNYAETWHAWSVQARRAYLLGFTDGNSRAYLAASKAWLNQRERYSKSVRVERVRLDLFLQFSDSALEPVITRLYQDPSNAFVNFDDMAPIARDQLLGRSSEDLLRKARERAVGLQTVIEQMKH